MTTLALVLAAVVVFGLLVLVVGQMCESGGMWFFHLMCGTPTALCRLLAAIVVAIVEQNE